MAEKRYSWIMSLALVSTLFIHACTTVYVTEEFTPITLKAWLLLDSFTPIILHPPPGETKLQMGPILAEDANYVELYYTEDFAPNVTPPAFTLYESHQSLRIGQDVLVKYSARRKDIDIEQTSLSLLDRKHPVEIRRKRNDPDAGVAIFVIEGTYVAYHWRNVTEAAALQVLAERIRPVREDETEIIVSFDQALTERKEQE